MTYNLHRLLFFIWAFFAMLSSGLNLAAQRYHPELEKQLDSLNLVFPFGVASGDPTDSSVVLWSRLWLPKADSVEVKLLIFADSAETRLLQEHTLFASKTEWWNLKTTIFCQENTTLYYRFITGIHKSPLGRTKTAPTSLVPKLSFLVVSCSNYQWGYFNAYRSMTTEKEIAAVIHLGDYIYEYGATDYFEKKLPGRRHLPPHEIVSESDYQTRYAQYRLDPDLAELHRLFPFITIWDDHEIANDAYALGAQNHQDSAEGNWFVRKKTAQKTYFDWLPIRFDSNYKLRRSLSFGPLAEVFLADQRLEARTEQRMPSNETKPDDAKRTILGNEQSSWLIQALKKSSARWKIIGNQVIFSSYSLPPSLISKIPKNGDSWIGYPYEREFLSREFHRLCKDSMLIVTGDAHASFGFVSRLDNSVPQSSFAREWVTPSVTSPNLDEYLAKWKVGYLRAQLKKKSLNPHVQYINLIDHGYLRVDISADNIQGTWKMIKTRLNPNPTIRKEYHISYH